MNWSPKDWPWPPRLAKGFGWLRRTIARALVTARNALLNIDRRDFRRIWVRLKVYASSYHLTALIVLALFATPLWVYFVQIVLTDLFDLFETGPTKDVDGNPDFRGHYESIAAIIAVLVALLAAPLALLKIYVVARKSTIAERQSAIAERQSATAKQADLADRMIKAMEKLGKDKTVKGREREIKYRLPNDPKRSKLHCITEIDGEKPNLPKGAEIRGKKGDWMPYELSEPNVEARRAAIFDLGRIAEDSERDHILIMETLCAYIRENAPANGAEDHALGDWPDWIEDPNGEARAEREADLEARARDLGRWTAALSAPRVDVQAALSVIGRRGEERIAHERRQRRSERASDPGFRLDLHGADLQNADLTRARLDHALLTKTRLEGADLSEAELAGADLSEARLDRAKLRRAGLEGANLREAGLERAILIKARLAGANLSEARLERADLGGKVGLEGADLRGARLERAILVGAGLERADLRGARLEGAKLVVAGLERADLRDARLEGTNLQRARLEGAKLQRARLEGANLAEARLEGAHLMEARLEGAHLELANLRFANLKTAELRDWRCARTSLRSADFTDAKHLTQDHVNAAYGDSATILPEGIAIPDHWDDETIGLREKDEKYQTWLAAGAPPGKPPQAPPG